MITSLRLKDFKNFTDETLHLGPLTIIVGANASGKSNLRDAFQFLQGLSLGFTLSEIIDGRFGPGSQVMWSGIRGPGLELCRLGRDTFALHVSLNSNKKTSNIVLKLVQIVDQIISFGLFMTMV